MNKLLQNAINSIEIGIEDYELSKKMIVELFLVLEIFLQEFYYCLSISWLN